MQRLFSIYIGKIQPVIVPEMAIKYLVQLAIAALIALNSCRSLAQNGGDSLLVGDSLAGNQSILSKNGTFELGFFSPNGPNNWYVGIWYAQILQKVVVWVANRDNPVKEMPGVLNFSSDGRLKLFDINGRSVWSLDIEGSKATLNESGNFIILGSGQNESELVWESFAHPGNTWLPGMLFWTGMKLTSWKSSSDPASGLFSYGMDMTPGKMQQMLFYNSSISYWSTGEWLGSYFTNVPEGNYSPYKYEFTCVKVSLPRFYCYIRVVPWGQFLSARILLSENGELKVLFLKDDGTWTQPWSTHGGQCSQYDICGANGLCNANDVCSCIEGFTPKNDSQSWWSSGCARRTPLQCSVTGGSTDGFWEAKDQYLPETEAVLYSKEQTQQGCRTACLNNCSCTAFAFDISNLPVCRLWFGDLLRMNVSSVSESVFIRLGASELPQLTSKSGKKSPILVILLPSLAAFFVLGLLLTAFILRKRRRLQKKRIEGGMPIMLKAFSYRELRIATENFKHKLGRGAFGSVFKGILPDSTLVAVKRLGGTAGAEKQFRAEINTIGNIQHVNLVRLYGFCVEGAHRLLVYAYMPNGSLNSFLFIEEKESEKLLDWKTRFQIALGTARGLVYLHEECRDQIIHCDIKPENILLDGDFNPKIADFGLAKLMGRDFSHVLTTTRGTPGYLAPEWIAGLPVTPKVDVYSFGMMLMEIISGRRNFDLTVEERSRLYFPTWASLQIQGANIVGVVDKRIARMANVEEVRRAAMVGVWCIQDNEEKRPSMGEVVKILEGTVEAPTPQIPRSLQVLLDQVEPDSSDTYVEHVSMLSCNYDSENLY